MHLSATLNPSRGAAQRARKRARRSVAREPHGRERTLRDLWYKDAIAEANIPPDEMLDYFARGRLQMGFNFVLNQHIFLALAGMAHP